MRLIKDKNISDLIMVVSIVVMNLKIIAPLMLFVDRKLLQGFYKKIGVAERMNSTIMECARSMRLHVGLPLNMWVEAVNTVLYLIN